jgi:phosphate transport system substrate-binding protein
VGAITEIHIGFDGIVIANSIKAPKINFTRHQLYMALAKEISENGILVPNHHFSWHEVSPSLPPQKIEVMGPPNTSGTRDMFKQLAVKNGCSLGALAATMDADKQKMVCTTLRQDGHFLEMGEDDLEIVKKLRIFENAFGIFGFSYVLRYSDIVQANSIDGILPTFETIESGKYPLSRPLYLYVKNRRVLSNPGLVVFLKEYLSEKAMGQEGYLQDIGLVPLGKEKQAISRSELSNLLKQ